MGPLLSNEKKPFLFISDLQMPFEHSSALKFVTYLVRHLRIPRSNIYCVGDETDQYWGGAWQKDINARHTALSEIKETKEHMKPWFDNFPEMRIAISNHGTRWQRKALAADIPEVLMKRYAEVLGCPEGWKWQKRWLIRTKRPMLVEHGDRFGSQYPHVVAATTNSMNTIIGHHHSIAGIEHIKTMGALDGCVDEAGVSVWGMCVGSLIDFEEYAFHYARDARKKPQIGVGVVFQEGAYPVWTPLNIP